MKSRVLMVKMFCTIQFVSVSCDGTLVRIRLLGQEFPKIDHGPFLGGRHSFGRIHKLPNRQGFAKFFGIARVTNFPAAHLVAATSFLGWFSSLF